MSRNKGALIGLALAAIAAVLILGPLASQGRVLLGLFLALTACVYLGGLLSRTEANEDGIEICQLYVETSIK